MCGCGCAPLFRTTEFLVSSSWQSLARLCWLCFRVCFAIALPQLSLQTFQLSGTSMGDAIAHHCLASLRYSEAFARLGTPLLVSLSCLPCALPALIVLLQYESTHFKECIAHDNRMSNEFMEMSNTIFNKHSPHTPGTSWEFIDMSRIQCALQLWFLHARSAFPIYKILFPTSS